MPHRIGISYSIWQRQHISNFINFVQRAALPFKCSWFNKAKVENKDGTFKHNLKQPMHQKLSGRGDTVCKKKQEKRTAHKIDGIFSALSKIQQ